MDAPDRPTLQSSRRRNWKAFLLHEWSLLLLAAALTVIIWWIVRGNVLLNHTITGVEVQVRVEPNNRSRLAAVITGDNKLDLTLYCSKREKEQVEEQLKKDGWRVEMLVRDVPGVRRQFNLAIDRPQWKFADDRILTGLDPKRPAGFVYRVARRSAPIQKGEPETVPPPQDLLKEGIEVTVTVSPPLVDILLPVDEPEEGLTADPIDIQKLLDEADFQFGQPIPFTVTFDRWRNQGTVENRPYRQQVDLPPVTAQVTLREVGTLSIKTDLHVLFDQVRYEYDLKSLQSVEGVRLVAGLTFEGVLAGSKADLDRLAEDAEKGRGTWAWGVRLKDRQMPPKPANGSKPEFTALSAEIIWLNLEGYADRGIRFVPKGNQDDFDIGVRWHSEHK